MYTSSMLRDSMAVMHKVEPVTLEGQGLLVASERTPLLKRPSQYHRLTRKDSGVYAPEEEEHASIIEKPSTARLVLVIGTAWLSILLGSLDSTVTTTLSAPISSEFDSPSLLPWLAAAYLISNAAVQPVAGRLTDIFGRRLVLAAGHFFFASGNLICGLSTNQCTIIFGRVLAGIGGGGMISVATFMTSDLTPPHKRVVMQGIANVWYGVGAMLGPVIGGLIQDQPVLGWRLAFFVQVTLSLLLIPAIWTLVKVPCEHKQPEKSQLEQIDFLGVFFTVSFLVLLVLGLNSGGNSVPWTHPLPLTTLPLSLLSFAGFLWWETRAKQPIIPVRLMQDPTVLAASFASLFISMVLMTSTLYMPLYFQILGDSTTTASLKFLPFPLGGAVGALAIGYAMSSTGKYKPFGILGALALIAGTAIFAFQDEETPVYLTGLTLFLAGGGFSSVSTTVTIACLAAVNHSQQALVTSAICKFARNPDYFLSIDSCTTLTNHPRSAVLARSVGGTLGIAIASAVDQTALKERLWDRFGQLASGPEEIHRILNGLEDLSRLPNGWREGVLASFMESFQLVWAVVVLWASMALVCIALLKQHTLRSRN
jgi:MFS family permease